MPSLKPACDTISSMPAIIHPMGQPDSVAEAAKVFGNTVRLSILHALRQGPALRGELARLTGVSSKTLGSQLAELEGLKVVSSEPQGGRGQPLLYYIDHTRLHGLLSALSEYVFQQESDEPRRDASAAPATQPRSR